MKSVRNCSVFAISRLLKITGVFCRIYSLLEGSFAQETYDFKEPTNHSHPIKLEVLLCFGLATISRLLKIIRLFCKIALQKRLHSAKETHNFKESTD